LHSRCYSLLLCNGGLGFLHPPLHSRCYKSLLCNGGLMFLHPPLHSRCYKCTPSASEEPSHHNRRFLTN